MEKIKGFKKTVLQYWRKSGRHNLPWRRTSDSYKILVSEIMLQQTQVDRVVPYYERFIKKFPTIGRLASGSLASVLQCWSGLGYNRRARLLRECAKEIVKKYGGTIPNDRPALVALPAIGPYTAGAIRAFAFNEPDIIIETNIRAALIHHFFPRSRNVDDKKLIAILTSLLTGRPLSFDRCIKIRDSKRVAFRGPNKIHPRVWYSALMDYGAYIKKTNPNPSRRSKHHVRQSPFEGSLRQARGAILRKLLDGPISERSLLRVDVKSSYQMELALRDLEREKLITKKKGKWTLAD